MTRAFNSLLKTVHSIGYTSSVFSFLEIFTNVLDPSNPFQKNYLNKIGQVCVDLQVPVLGWPVDRDC